MIKDARDVIDPLPAFDHSQQKVVVLRAVKLRAESTDLVHKLPPNDGEVAKIIEGEKKIRRPIRFEAGRVETFLGELVFVGINQTGVRMFLEPFHILKKRLGFEQIIVIEKADPIALGESEA